MLVHDLGNSLSNWGLPFGESFTSSGEKIDEADAKGHGLDGPDDGDQPGDGEAFR